MTTKQKQTIKQAGAEHAKALQEIQTIGARLTKISADTKIAFSLQQRAELLNAIVHIEKLMLAPAVTIVMQRCRMKPIIRFLKSSKGRAAIISAVRAN
jgi:hypothetical protein